MADETYLKAIFRFLVRKRLPSQAIELHSKKAVGNRFPHIGRGQKRFTRIGVHPYAYLNQTELDVVKLNC